jgi:hypothetical protein
MRKGLWIILSYIFLLANVPGMNGQKQYDSYKGLVMAGYQGWFNTPDDGADRGWHHYNGKNGFKPGSCSIDFWPDVSDYPVLYRTDFEYKDGTTAYTFSSYDPSTVDVHFGWMKDYGIDGVFMQRFISEIKNPSGKKHFDLVLASAVKASKKYERAICVMYDLSGMWPGDEKLLLKDIDTMEEEHKIKNADSFPNYLYHNGKPLVAVWGVGFDDKRKYGLKEVNKIVDGLISRGYSVMIGVPTYWRTLDNDTERNPELHTIIKKCDILLPWFVGRYDEKIYESFRLNIKKDMEWCRENGIDYVPLCYPGFSWKNMRGTDSFYVDRNSGSFLWKQFSTVIDYDAEMIYVAMFDEIDEGTAIFRCANRNNVPDNGKIKFEGIEDDLPTDHYLWLTGEAGRMLRREIEFTDSVPIRNKQFLSAEK